MNLAKEYARAIYEVRTAGRTNDGELIGSIVAALSRRRHQMLMPRIAEEYARTEQEAGKDAILIRAASEQEAHKGLSKLRDLGYEGTARMLVDPKVVKGYVLEGKDFRYDASARRALIDLYKKLTA